MIFPHTLLVSGNDFEACCQQARDFLKTSKVLDYEHLEIVEAESCSGGDPNFCRRLNASIKKHRENIAFLVNELNQMGIHSVEDIENMEQGYPSKILHILGHLLDGYVCVDSRFYNLVDRSHHVPQATVANIKSLPQLFWLVRVNGHRASDLEASLLH
ncbi:MAG: hypothetical protein LBU39_07855 [Desulfobulbaceae bacterium]|jgi:hypothetical protein|nr:hypothetical protein [Desulfobulbaceae bacterium]